MNHCLFLLCVRLGDGNAYKLTGCSVVDFVVVYVWQNVTALLFALSEGDREVSPNEFSCHAQSQAFTVSS